MISDSAIQKLKGLRNLRYMSAQKDQEWKFILTMVDALLDENQKLRTKINEINQTTKPNDNTREPGQHDSKLVA